MTPFPDIVFISEEATGCINEDAIGAINETAIGSIIAPRNPPSHFLFHVLQFQQHHQLINLNLLVTLRF